MWWLQFHLDAYGQWYHYNAKLEIAWIPEDCATTKYNWVPTSGFDLRQKRLPILFLPQLFGFHPHIVKVMSSWTSSTQVWLSAPLETPVSQQVKSEAYFWHGPHWISLSRIWPLYSCHFIYPMVFWSLIIQLSKYINIKWKWWKLLFYSGSRIQAFWISRKYIPSL